MKSLSRRNLVAVVLVGLALVSLSEAAQAQEVWMAGSGGKFGKVNVTTGVYTSIAASGTSLFGLANVRESLLGLRSDGTTLVRLNTTTGAQTVLGAITGLGASTLISFTSIGSTIYAFDDSANSRIFTINPDTRVATLLGSSGFLLDAIAWSPGGTLYGTSFTSAAANSTYNFNTGTGAATQLTTNAGYTTSVFALAYTGTTLYGIQSTGGIRTINLTTGVSTATGFTLNTATTGVPFAAATVLTAPEPTTLALAGLGALGLVAIRRRRAK